ncbi:MAG: tRNA lysidine(34) synthetase TilS, partial [Armatimonadetes bacterium]|nr:tRNA lysidine(34) synthetase TilS [Armatimonadota bacterium]
MTLKEKVLKTIRKYQLISNGEKIILALSGGGDSVGLLFLLNDLKIELNFSLQIIHINHLIRKEAEIEEKFVKKIAQKLNLPIFIFKEEVLKYAQKNKLSLEEAGRIIRQKYYFQLLKKQKADKLATAHTLDDQAETVLMRLLRGTGIEGLRGILPVNLPFIRPLIEITKEEILKYLKDRNIPYCLDLSNQNLNITRNKIRHRLLPLLEEYNPNFKKLLFQISWISQINEDFLEQISKKFIDKAIIMGKNELEINLKIINPLHLALKTKILRTAIKRLNNNLKNFTYRNFQDLLNLFSKDTSKKLNLPGNLLAYKNYDNLIIGRRTSKTKKLPKEIVKFPGEKIFPDWEIKISAFEVKKAEVKDDKNAAYIDLEKLKGKLILRPRQNGDKFTPLGFKGAKKL